MTAEMLRNRFAKSFKHYDRQIITLSQLIHCIHDELYFAGEPLTMEEVAILVGEAIGVFESI